MKFFSKALLIAKIKGEMIPLVCSNVSFKPINSKTLARGHLKTHFGSDDFVVDTGAIDLGFELEIPENIDTNASILQMMIACGFMINDKKLVLCDTAQPIEFFYYIDDILHMVSGAIGTFDFNFKSGELAMIKFNFKGLVSLARDTQTPIVDFAEFNPVVVSPATAEVVFGDYSLEVVDFGFSLGNSLSEHRTISTHNIVLINRASKGNISVEGESVADFDMLSLLADGTVVDMKINLGKLEFFLPATKLSSTNYTNQEGRLVYQMELVVLPVLGNDEIIIEIKQ